MIGISKFPSPPPYRKISPYLGLFYFCGKILRRMNSNHYNIENASQKIVVRVRRFNETGIIKKA